MKYDQRTAVRFIAESAGISLTDDELAALLTEHGSDVEAMGRKVREAAQAYEGYIVRIASTIREPQPSALIRAVTRPTVDSTETPVREASMNESSQRRN